MARPTALRKEPSKPTVSIALPQSEKDRLAGRPPQASPPVRQGPSLQRVSPGVYRNQRGQLVGSRGQALPRQSPPRGQMPNLPTEEQPQMPPRQNVGQGLTTNLSNGQSQPSYRPPAPNAPMWQFQQPPTQPYLEAPPGMYLPYNPEMMASAPWWKVPQGQPVQTQPLNSRPLTQEQMQQLINGMKSNGNY